MKGDVAKWGDARNFAAHAGHQLQLKLNKFHREGMLSSRSYVLIVSQEASDEIMSVVDSMWLRASLPHSNPPHTHGPQSANHADWSDLMQIGLICYSHT